MKFKVGSKVRYLERECVVVECIDEELKEGNKNVYIITDGNRFTTHANENELEYIKPTINDLRDYMLEHFVDNNGNLDVCGLDFSDFNGDVYLSGMKVGRNLNQSDHTVRGYLIQSDHTVRGNLNQSDHTVGGYLIQMRHKVGGSLKQSGHKVDGGLSQSWQEVQGDYMCNGVKFGGDARVDEPQKLLKEITKEELAEMGYKLKGVK